MSLNVKKGDSVVVIAGKDKSKSGKVLEVSPKDGKVLVENVNIVTKHQKPRSQQDKGGIVKKPAAIDASNVMIIDPKTKQVLKTIEPSTKIKAKIGNLGLWSRNSYIEYDGVKGIADTYYLVPKDTEDKYKFDHDMKIYDTVYVGDTISGNVIGMLPANTTFKSRYMADYDYVYYESGTIKGWINESGYDYESEQDKIDNNEDVKKEVENEEIKEIIAPKKDYTIYYCIGGAVLLAVISSISIILVNKSRKNK